MELTTPTEKITDRPSGNSRTNGLDGARIDRIARNARVNKAMI
jgi:hypothetical protein